MTARRAGPAKRKPGGRVVQKAQKAQKVPNGPGRAQKAQKAKNARAKKSPPLQLQVVDRGKPRTDGAMLRRVVRAALLHCDRSDLAVSILLTDDREIAELHEQFLADPTPTDVISFDIDGDAELVVSVETARRTAKELGHTVRAEVALYVVHGILHVCGFDDVRPRERVRMRRAEQEVMRSLRLTVTAVDAE